MTKPLQKNLFEPVRAKAKAPPTVAEKIHENPRAKMEIQEAFDDFHHCNPHVYRKLRDYALQIRARGFRKYSIKTIWEVMRWHSDIETDEQKHFKLNDHYYSRYARMLMKNERELDGFFEIRGLRS